MKIELIKSNDPRLKRVCEEVVDFENKEFYEDLITQIKEECITQKAFAAAAPQFGINKRFIVMVSAVEPKVKTVEDFENFHVDYEVTPYFNPRITLMRGMQKYYEACMSVGEVIGKVTRPFYIEFDYQDIDGKNHTRTAEDFEAIVFCHEIDHLDGIEFTSKAENIINDANLEKRIEVRNKEPKEILSKDSVFDQSGIVDKFKTKIYPKRENG